MAGNSILSAIPKPEKRECPICKKPLTEKTYENVFERGDKITVDCLQCDCLHKESDRKKLEQSYSSCGLPKKYVNEELIDWIPVPGTETMHGVTIEWLGNRKENIANGVGCILVGPIGTGKTKHAAYIQRQLIKDGYSTYFIDSKTLCMKIAKMKKMHNNDYYEFMDHLHNVQVLIYDDVGESQPESWNKDDVTSVVTERSKNMKTTIYTVMYDKADLGKKLGDHITSRILGSCRHYISVNESHIDMRLPENREKYLGGAK